MMMGLVSVCVEPVLDIPAKAFEVREVCCVCKTFVSPSFAA